MRAGIVSTIRINPRDAQSILDVLDAAGVQRNSLSFAQCTSLALGALLETARQNGLIPEPDEFQYLNRLAPYIGPGKKTKKARIAGELHNIGGSLRAPTVVGQPVQAQSSRWASSPQAAVGPAELATPRATESDVDVEAAKVELSALIESSDQFGDVSDWPKDRQQRYLELYRIVYPDG